jgi:HAD superfamily hydrolase (TIGR01509 family)
MDFLEELESAGIQKAIATSAPRANVDFTLRYTQTEKYFRVILDEAFVTRGKPDPEIYLKTAAALGYTPAQCVVIEDSLSGVRAGKSAGCKVIGITTTHTPQELAETDLIIPDFSSLTPAHLQNLFRQ